MSREGEISICDLRDQLAYDCETGILTWKVRPRRFFMTDRSWRRTNNTNAGRVAGGLSSKGYLAVKICDITFKAHRVAWALHYGKWPDGEVDHENGDKQDNRIKNLRDVTTLENGKNRPSQANSTSGYIGVSYHKQTGKWAAKIKVNQRNIWLGIHETPELAHAARQKAEVEHGFHKNHGRTA